MCEFCIQHGEGKKWYLNARNYGLDLASDVRRRRFIADFFNYGGQLASDVEGFSRLDRAPGVIKALVRGHVTRRMKRQHFGQVLPLEDVREVMAIANSVVRVPCICRSHTRGATNARYCFGVSVSPKAVAFADVDPKLFRNPDTGAAERLEPEAALDMMSDFERQGLVHSVWTFITPFIGGICNCDRSDCIAMISTVGHDLKLMFKAEWVARLDWETCKGCRACMRQCQFGVIGYSAAAGKCAIDQARCWGCGVCRAACTTDSISLIPRTEVAGLRW